MTVCIGWDVLWCVVTRCGARFERHGQSTRSNGHLALSATHLAGTECWVRASCVVPCARAPRRPPWSLSLSLSAPHPGLASPRSSRLRLSLRRPTAYQNLGCMRARERGEYLRYGVAAISRLLKIIGLFCRRALHKRLYSAKETYNCKEPTPRSHPIVHSMRGVGFLQL